MNFPITPNSVIFDGSFFKFCLQIYFLLLDFLVTVVVVPGFPLGGISSISCGRDFSRGAPISMSIFSFYKFFEVVKIIYHFYSHQFRFPFLVVDFQSLLIPWHRIHLVFSFYYLFYCPHFYSNAMVMMKLASRLITDQNLHLSIGLIYEACS